MASPHNLSLTILFCKQNTEPALIASIHSTQETGTLAVVVSMKRGYDTMRGSGGGGGGGRSRGSQNYYGRSSSDRDDDRDHHHRPRREDDEYRRGGGGGRRRDDDRGGRDRYDDSYDRDRYSSSRNYYNDDSSSRNRNAYRSDFDSSHRHQDRYRGGSSNSSYYQNNSSSSSSSSHRGRGGNHGGSGSYYRGGGGGGGGGTSGSNYYQHSNSNRDRGGNMHDGNNRSSYYGDNHNSGNQHSRPPAAGQRGGGRGGGSRGPDLSGINSVISNIIMAQVSPAFAFCQYSVDFQDSNGRPIDSRHRKKFLFDNAFWNGLLKDMPDKEKQDLQRVVFFCGTFFFSARPIPGLEPQTLPLLLPTSQEAEGDTATIKHSFHYLAPTELQTAGPAVASHEVALENRCKDCTRAFGDYGSLLQHCQQSNHEPVTIPDQKDIDSSAKPAPIDTFVAYINGALKRALGERLASWGSEFIDPQSFEEPSHPYRGGSLGVRVYKAYSAQFGILRDPETNLPTPAMTVDLRAKIVRTKSVLDLLCEGRGDPNRYQLSYRDQEDARRKWIGEVVIAMHDKKCYTVVDLDFQHSANTLPIESLGMSHAEYFEKRKGRKLQYPDARPLIVVIGRRDQRIHLPAELVAGNELETSVREQLPKIASYLPEARNDAIDTIKSYLIPGAQKTKGAGGLLPALGVVLNEERLKTKATVLPIPTILSRGIKVPRGKDNWTPMLSNANFRVEPKEANTLNVIVFYNKRIRQQDAETVYGKLKTQLNNMNASFRFGENPYDMIEAGDDEKHWGAVERALSGKLPDNVFVLDFNKPRGGTDRAYSYIKQILTQNGHLSQFVNFQICRHDDFRNNKTVNKSNMILGGVARQILQKTGVRLWYTEIPKELPLPAVFVGIDIFHAPKKYDPKTKERTAKASCAAIIVEAITKDSTSVQIYSETHKRNPGVEYHLKDAIKSTIQSALKALDVNPNSCVVYRDGIGDSAFQDHAVSEIEGVRAGLSGNNVVGLQSHTPQRDVPMSYIVCQKRIDTKFLTAGVPNEKDGKYGAPPGTLIEDVQGLHHETFYLNGRAPPTSTPKPARFVVLHDDLKQVNLKGLTHNLTHSYPNWAGPIKVPGVCQLAHKNAELVGGFMDCGEGLDANMHKNKLYYL